LKKLIIVAALTGAGTLPTQTPHLPIGFSLGFRRRFDSTVDIFEYKEHWRSSAINKKNKKRIDFMHPFLICLYFF
jgi:hypothetical protein